MDSIAGQSCDEIGFPTILCVREAWVHPEDSCGNRNRAIAEHFVSR